MKTLSQVGIAGLTAFLGATGLAQAAAIERAIPSTTRLLFEDGSYAEIGLTYTDPNQRGDGVVLPPRFTGAPFDIPLDGRTQDLFDPYWSFSGAFKTDLRPDVSFALTIDQPYGADTSYGADSFPSPPLNFTYDGTGADVDTVQYTGVLAYDVRPDVKVFAGLRAMQSRADAQIPFLGPTGGLPPYDVHSDTEWGYGYLAGAAYSREDIALRLSLTYYSDIDVSYDIEEFGLFDSETDVTFPQSLALEFQTGIAPKTLLFGSVRWVDWSEFEIAPEQYVALVGSPLVAYEDDWYTYQIGLGRQITDRLAGSVSLIYEPSVGGDLTTLGPYDGRTLGTAALSYDFERFNVTGGLVFGKLGDTGNVLETDYDDGSLFGAGIRFGYTF